MSRAVARRYRVRFATRGADEVEGYVEFSLELADLAEVPVVAGSFVHPLDGATELRPLNVLGVDYDGGLIEAFTLNGRWAALGRLVDLQWQAADEDPDSGTWTTYGTGRCSGLDEADGPGRFRIEISDESWVSRRAKVFDVAGTTSVWPSGVLGAWRGFPESEMAAGVIAGTDGSLYRIDLSANLVANYRGREITDLIIEWIRNNLKDPDSRVVANNVTAGNWQHLRLNYPNENGVRVDWEIVSFGSISSDPGAQGLLASLEEPTITNAGTVDETWTIYAWVYFPGLVFVPPAATGYGYLYAPQAPPDRLNPLHVGMMGSAAKLKNDHPWGTPWLDGDWGFIHVADLTRRVWTAMGVRYDESSLAAIEADLTFPVLAPRIFEVPDNPEKLMQERAWGPLMLLALKDRYGRRKLKDIRPPTEDADLSALPILDISNSKGHRWRLVGREQMNSITWQYHRLRIPGEPPEGYKTGGAMAVRVRDFDQQADTLDWFITQELELPAVESDDVELVGRRNRAFNVQDLLADPWSRPSQLEYVTQANIGLPFIGDVMDAHSDTLLGVYQDGPVDGTCEISGTLAETLEEGDYAIVDCRSVKIANAGRAARAGLVLVLLLSLTRFPAHVEAEYRVYRPVQVFECPTEEDLDTWLVTPLGEAATIRLALGALTAPASDFALEVDARKNATGGQAVTMTVTLYQGNTLIASDTPTTLTATLATYTLNLNSSDQAAITNWADLFIEIERSGATGGAASTWRRMEVARIGVA